MDILGNISVYAVPIVFITILASGLSKGEKVFDVFLEGSKQGISTIIRIIPPLVGLMVAISVFRASGALDLIIYAVSPVMKFIGIPPEVLPLALLRPISGSASLAMTTDIIKAYGADSLIGRIASTMMGSTETTFYTLTIYFGAISIRDTGFTIVAALIADFVSVAASVWICTVLFA